MSAVLTTGSSERRLACMTALIVWACAVAALPKATAVMTAQAVRRRLNGGRNMS
jgi:hypothetical protein